MRTDEGFAPLVTDRLVLRRSRPEDAEAISAYRSDPTVNAMQGWERIDPEGIRRGIEDMARLSPGAPDWVQFSLEEREGGRLVGDVGLCGVAEEPGVVKVGYTIAPDVQGRGYATEAVRALVTYAFDMLGADLVRAYANAENLPSIRVMEKLGMRLVERIERRDERGERDIVRYELPRGA